MWSRLARLTEDERHVLEVMSIVPGSVEPWLIPALLGAEAGILVDRCVARGLLRRDENGSLAFRHELARQATLDRLPPTQQRALHAKCGGGDRRASRGAGHRPAVAPSAPRGRG